LNNEKISFAGERGSSYKYLILDIEEIKALPVKKIIDRNCYLEIYLE